MSVFLSSNLLIFLVGSFLAQAAPATLTVAAASDLTTVAPKLQALYAQKEKGTTLRLVFSASGALKQQIESSAPFDVSLSANASYIDELATAGKIDAGSVMVYGQGQLGVLWRDGRKHPLREITTPLARFIALPNPKLAPYGLAAQQALEYGGLWQMAQGKVVYAENVRQALQLVESGNADVVITAASLLEGKGADKIPTDWHKPIIQKAGVLTASSNKEAARRFLAFLQTPEAKALLAANGLTE